MTPTDPMLPFWALFLTLVSFAFGFLAGRACSRKNRRPSTNWKRP